MNIYTFNLIAIITYKKIFMVKLKIKLYNIYFFLKTNNITLIYYSKNYYNNLFSF